jgi:phosphatidylinositol 4-kinase B
LTLRHDCSRDPLRLAKINHIFVQLKLDKYEKKIKVLEEKI